MSLVVDGSVEVTLKLPKEIYDRLIEFAHREQQELEKIAIASIARGLETNTNPREILERVSLKYRQRLERLGKLHQSSDEVLEELQQQREKIVEQLYS